MQQRRRLILVVEDDPDDRFLIKEALIPYQGAFDLEFFEGGQDLLDYLGKRSPSGKSPDLIILDLNLPSMRGEEVLTEIKSYPKYENVPVVIFTVSDSPEDVDRARRLGAAEFATKPGPYSEFYDVVKLMVQKWVFKEEGGRNYPVGK